MPFIRTIPPAEAQGPVREMYERIEKQQGMIPNWAHVFSLRPSVQQHWAAFLGSIRSNMSVRGYELATLAAARALCSTYCSMAHGSVLAEQVFDPDAVTAIMRDSREAPLEAGERAMMAFVDKMIRNADQIAAADVESLRSHGYTDEEIFDITAAAAARCFFSKLLDALGVQADAKYNDIDPAMREALTVGRPVAAR